jgi:hypothetical protein
MQKENMSKDPNVCGFLCSHDEKGREHQPKPFVRPKIERQHVLAGHYYISIPYDKADRAKHGSDLACKLIPCTRKLEVEPAIR